MYTGNISSAITATDKTTILNDIAAIKNLLPFLVNLTAADRKRMRKLGHKRLAYVQALQTAVAYNAQAVPSSFNTAEFNKDVQLVKDLTDIATQLVVLHEAIDDTLKAVGAEAMHEADEAYGYLKVVAAKSPNQALTNVVHNIASMLRHAGNANGNGANGGNS